MNKAIKIKNGAFIASLLKDPVKLAILIELSFSLNDKGEAFYVVPKKWEVKFRDLLKVGLISEGQSEGFYVVSSNFVEKPKQVKPDKNFIGNQLLRGDSLIVPKGQEEAYNIALEFNKLFYRNLVQIKARTQNVENAKFNNWVSPVRLMKEKDGVTTKQLREVYEFLKDSDFWRYNVQSTQKLREKFNTIHTQANGKKGNNNSKPEGKVSTDYVRGVLSDLRTNGG